MDALLKSFSLGFLLRSVFSGMLFVVAFRFCEGGPSSSLSEPHPEGSLTYFFAVALFAGVSIYGIHRSLIYPWIEWIFDTRMAKDWRKNGLSLISFETLNRMAAHWDREADQGKEWSTRIGRITAWADYAHLQYCSCWCIIGGAICGKLTFASTPLEPCKSLFVLTCIFGVGALVSDWRLHSLQEGMEIRQPYRDPIPKTQSEKAVEWKVRKRITVMGLGVASLSIICWGGWELLRLIARD